jgi:phosphonate transport system substrate-binding protein
MAELVTFGIPFITEELSHGVGKAFAQILERHLGDPVSLRVAASYGQLGDNLAEGLVDFAWLPPVEAAHHSAFGVHEVLLQAIRGGNPYYYAVIFVQADTAIERLEQLAGKRVAFVNRRSASGYIVAAGILAEAGVEIEQPPSFLRSHGAVVEAVANGEAIAGATFGSFEGKPSKKTLVEVGWNVQEADPGTEMRALAWDGPIPSDAICAWLGTSRMLRAALKKAFRDVAADPEGKEVMHRLFGTERFEDADQVNYEALEASISRLRGG